MVFFIGMFMCTESMFTEKSVFEDKNKKLE